MIVRMEDSVNRTGHSAALIGRSIASLLACSLRRPRFTTWNILSEKILCVNKLGEQCRQTAQTSMNIISLFCRDWKISSSIDSG